MYVLEQVGPCFPLLQGMHKLINLQAAQVIKESKVVLATELVTLTNPKSHTSRVLLSRREWSKY